jgi:hypothetical protein
MAQNITSLYDIIIQTETDFKKAEKILDDVELYSRRFCTCRMYRSSNL